MPDEQAITLKETQREAETSALIDNWHFDAFHGSRLGMDTEMWNLVATAKEDLKHRLACFLKENDHGI
ncbi:MAG: hypothetical protein ACREC9_13600 [Methylocella sp.]